MQQLPPIHRGIRPKTPGVCPKPWILPNPILTIFFYAYITMIKFNF